MCMSLRAKVRECERVRVCVQVLCVRAPVRVLKWACERGRAWLPAASLETGLCREAVPGLLGPLCGRLPSAPSHCLLLPTPMGHALAASGTFPSGSFHAWAGPHS